MELRLYAVRTQSDDDDAAADEDGYRDDEDGYRDDEDGYRDDEDGDGYHIQKGDPLYYS